MSGDKKRVQLIQVLLAGSPVIAKSGSHSLISGEFQEILLVHQIRNKTRRHLLEMFHAARALDTTLKAFVQHPTHLPAMRVQRPSMGAYLVSLQNHMVSGLGRITATERHHFQQCIVNRRNLYLHEAGRAPCSATEVSQFLDEVTACIARVLSL